MHSPALPAPLHGAVPDTSLERLIAIGHALREDRPLTDDDGRLIVRTLGAVASELLNTRRKMSVIADLADPGNVCLFPGGR